MMLYEVECVERERERGWRRHSVAFMRSCDFEITIAEGYLTQYIRCVDYSASMFH